MAKKKTHTPNDFDLNKGAQHQFDIKKGSSHKFDLSKDDDETGITSGIADPKTTEDPTVELLADSQEAAKKRGWMWIVVIIALLLALAIWWFMKNPSGQAEGSDADSTKTEQTADKAEPDNDNTVQQSPDQSAGEVSVPSQNDTETGAEIADNFSSTGNETTAQNSSTESVASSNSQVGTTQSSNAAVAATNNHTTASNPSVITSSPTADIETEALNVIRGVYGDGNARRQALGSRYAEIQARVNQMKRDGLF